MRELKIVAILVVVVGVLYWGVEPLAHSIFHPKKPSADFSFSDLNATAVASDINITKGSEIAMTCTGCHSIKSAGFEAPMSAEDSIAAYGVVAPDLSNMTTLYDEHFLVNFLLDPVNAIKLGHKFGTDKFYAMTPGLVLEEDIPHLLGYFKSIAKNDLSDKEVFIESCARCHSMKYDKVAAGLDNTQMLNYLGSKAPDLSTMIRSKGAHYLELFINDPSKMLDGTAMPRVGLNESAQKQVIAYMEKVGDAKKDERESLGVWLIGFMVILAILAYLWKNKIWREVH